jgi:arabinan endo-1,5-alpha-L-arabinosidase
MNWTKRGRRRHRGQSADQQRHGRAGGYAFAWAQVTDLWAPDVVKLADGKFYQYYCACKGDSPRSALGVAVADKVEGPYVNKGRCCSSRACGAWSARMA